MKKLGFVIKITQNGESEHSSLGKDGQWDKYATDARSSIKELEGFDETGKTVTLIKFLGTNGYLIGIIKARPEGSGRAFDNTAAWIHFPSRISINSEDIIVIIDKVKEAISGRLGIDVPLLKQLFDKDYSSNNPLFSAVESIKSNENGTLGVIYYGNDCNYRLHELLGEFIVQHEYATYKGIFLIDKSSNISLPGKESIKIDPKKPITIGAPESNNEGFIPYICGQKFDKSVTFPADKEGYADIPKKFVANDKFKDSDIQITSKDYNICINGDKLNEKSEIPYDSLKGGVKLTVAKDGFDPYEDEKIKESPLNGFNCGGNNVLYPDNRKVKFKFFVYGIAASLMTSALFVGLLYNSELNNRKTSEKTDQDNVEAQNKGQNKTAQNPLAAIHNLDSAKDSLEHDPKTEGLFNALNIFDIDKIRIKLEFKKFKKIVTLLDSAKNKGIEVGPNYKKNENENEIEIDVNECIQWISKKLEESTKSASPASEGSSTGPGAPKITDKNGRNVTSE